MHSHFFFELLVSFVLMSSAYLLYNMLMYTVTCYANNLPSVEVDFEKMNDGAR